MRPAVPAYWRCTPAEVVPFLRKPVSSRTRMPSGSPVPRARRSRSQLHARRSRREAARAAATISGGCTRSRGGPGKRARSDNQPTSAGDLVPVEDHQRADEPGGPLHVEAEPGQYAPVLQVCEGVFADGSFCGDQLVDLLLRGRELLALGLLAAGDLRAARGSGGAGPQQPGSARWRVKWMIVSSVVAVGVVIWWSSGSEGLPR